jgi:hypothetical protein
MPITHYFLLQMPTIAERIQAVIISALTDPVEPGFTLFMLLDEMKQCNAHDCSVIATICYSKNRMVPIRTILDYLILYLAYPGFIANFQDEYNFSTMIAGNRFLYSNGRFYQQVDETFVRIGVNTIIPYVQLLL